jgi:hypothetical protein
MSLVGSLRKEEGMFFSDLKKSCEPSEMEDGETPRWGDDSAGIGSEPFSLITYPFLLIADSIRVGWCPFVVEGSSLRSGVMETNGGAARQAAGGQAATGRRTPWVRGMAALSRV